MCMCLLPRSSYIHRHCRSTWRYIVRIPSKPNCDIFVAKCDGVGAKALKYNMDCIYLQPYYIFSLLLPSCFIIFWELCVL
jgi:hypothetical protein